MKKNIKVPYALKKLALGAAVVALPVFTSCEKDKPEPQKHNVTIKFGLDDNFATITPEKVKVAAAPNDVGNVILESDGKLITSTSATVMREDVLEPVFNTSSKVIGKGNLNGVGVRTEKHRADSLWLVQQGFTVNKR